VLLHITFVTCPLSVEWFLHCVCVCARARVCGEREVIPLMEGWLMSNLFLYIYFVSASHLFLSGSFPILYGWYLFRLLKTEQSLQHVTLNKEYLRIVLDYEVCTGWILTVLIIDDSINQVLECQPVRYKYGFHQYGFSVTVSLLVSCTVPVASPGLPPLQLQAGCILWILQIAVVK
jgi:hypothetical protein